ncbi:hypothetical protein BPA30113_00783 [Burkholderia paludis]|uniref:Uncharacterized protein n=2 Tax=Burkholderiaceae TaxID=119060 RepID=A0A6J5CYK9_9BURK|nr:hypothetical protein LMG30113_00098 [Burkholderia paludis]VWB22982.1 hypothetical protein BPA30113_00783 [Burkholderia paludis]
MAWGAGMLVAGFGLFSVFCISLAIGVFDQLGITMDDVSFIVIVAVLMAAIGLILIVVGLVNAFRARRSVNQAEVRR